MAEAELAHIESVLEQLELAEQQLNQLQAELARHHRLATLGTLAAIVAHEFNNLLTPVISYCQLALKQDFNEDPDLVRKALTRAHDGATKAAQIASSMLGFSRKDQGQADCLVLQVVNEVFACLARDPAKDGIELTIDIPDNLAAAISPLALQQVIMNLVLNARDAMRSHRGKLTLTAGPIDTHFCQITVADTGPGIEPDLLPHLFKPFVTRKTNPLIDSVGTGLGLAICHDLITRASGSIHVNSTPGQGATFTLKLPMPQAKATSDE